MPLADRGFDVHAATSRPGATLPAETHVLDLMDPVATRELVRTLAPTHLLHLAWYVEPGQFWNSPLNLDWIGASLALYRSFVEARGQRFVGAGTCTEYDWSYDWLDETTTPCVPGTLYGTAKNALFHTLAAAARVDDLSFAWGRIFFLYGPGEKPRRLISDAVAGLSRGEAVETTAGTQIRDFMHVADVAAAFAALVDSPVNGAVNIATGEAHPIRDILAHLGKITGRADLLRIGARAMPANEAPCLSAAITRLRDEVGFKHRFSLVEGLTDTVSQWGHAP